MSCQPEEECCRLYDASLLGTFGYCWKKSSLVFQISHSFFLLQHQSNCNLIWILFIGKYEHEPCKHKHTKINFSWKVVKIGACLNIEKYGIFMNVYNKRDYFAEKLYAKEKKIKD